MAARFGHLWVSLRLAASIAVPTLAVAAGCGSSGGAGSGADGRPQTMVEAGHDAGAATDEAGASALGAVDATVDSPPGADNAADSTVPDAFAAIDATEPADEGPPDRAAPDDAVASTDAIAVVDASTDADDSLSLTDAGGVDAACVPPDAACGAGQTGDPCNVTIDGCGGTTTVCQCDANHYCSTASSASTVSPGTCVPKKTCADYTDGGSGASCSNGGAFDDGTGNLLTCTCTGGANAYCISGAAPNGTSVSGSQVGMCCTDTAACGSACDTTVPNTCVSAPAAQHVCGTGCGGTGFCSGTSCVTYKTCAQLGAAGRTVGAQCSNGQAFDSGDGRLIACPCIGAGLACSQGGAVVGSVPAPAPRGTCCQSTCVSTGCDGMGVNQCTGVPCATPCPAGKICVAGGCVQQP